MKLEELDASHVLLNEALLKVRARIVAISLELLSADTIGELTSDRGRLEAEEQGLLKSISDIRFRMLEAEKQARKQIGVAERERKEKLWAALKRRKNPCEKCGAPTKILSDIVQPQFRSGSMGWEAVSDDWRHWYVEVLCTRGSCRLQDKIYPDKPKDDEEE